MNFTSVANELLFQSRNWENFPYRTSIDGAGDLHFYKCPGKIYLNNSIPNTYVKINVRETLRASYPEEFPNMDRIGYAILEVLRNNGVKNFITAEDRGWESSDFWATLEAVFISPEDFNAHLLPKINKVALSTLHPETKKPVTCNPKLVENQQIQFFQIHTKLERACVICEDIKEDHIVGSFIQMSHGEKSHHELIENLAQTIFKGMCKADKDNNKKVTVEIPKVKDQHIELVQWVFKQKLDLEIKIEEKHRSEDCIFLVDRVCVSWN